MDSVSKAIRSRIMARVKQKDSQIERRLRLALWSAGIRYRKNVRIFGTPDLVISANRVLIFVDSCFWHGCRFHYQQPKSNADFWQSKIDRNRRRDRKVTRHYRRKGWTVVRFWEHQLAADFERCVQRVVQMLAEKRE
jgi:DNA mismatch endonuclease (patch repair protein)